MRRRASLLMWMALCSPLILNAGDQWDIGTPSDLEHQGTVTDDWFLRAKAATLAGEYQGDLWIYADSIHFTGAAEDDVRMLSAERLSIEGPIKGNLSAAALAGNILVSTNAVVEGDVRLQGGKRITLSGTFKRDVTVSALNVVVQGDIDGTLTVDAPQIQLLPGTRIGGDLISTHSRDLPIPEGVELVGIQKQEQNFQSLFEEQMRRWFWWLLAIQLVSALLVGILLLRLVPRFLGQAVDLAVGFRGTSIGVGALTLLVGGSAGILFFDTRIALGTGLFLLTVTGLLFYTGQIVMALALGATLLRSKKGFSFARLSLAMLLGLFILSVLFSVAFIGLGLYILVSCWGMGALVLAIRNSQQVIRTEIPPNLQRTDSPSEEANS